jgi:glucan endo-1,3-alpha-glucosidase
MKSPVALYLLLIINYRTAVSPWQFKNLGSESGDLDNDWVELSDTLWKYRWEQAINDVIPDIVE